MIVSDYVSLSLNLSQLCLVFLWQDEESASDDFMEPNNRTDGSQALEWDIEGAEPDDYE